MMAALVVFEADGVRVLAPTGTIEGILIGDEVGVRCDGTACSDLEDVRCFLRKFIARLGIFLLVEDGLQLIGRR